MLFVRRARRVARALPAEGATTKTAPRAHCSVSRKHKSGSGLGAREPICFAYAGTEVSRTVWSFRFSSGASVWRGRLRRLLSCGSSPWFVRAYRRPQPSFGCRIAGYRVNTMRGALRGREWSDAKEQLRPRRLGRWRTSTRRDWTSGSCLRPSRTRPRSLPPTCSASAWCRHWVRARFPSLSRISAATR